MTFIEMLQGAQRRNGSMLCVGLDPEPTRFPAHLKGDAGKIYDFCARIVDATADLVIAFKPQIAYFAAHRAEGQLEQLMEHMRRAASHVPVILMPSAATSVPPRSNTPRKPSSATAPTR